MSNQDSGTTPSAATRAQEEAEAATGHQADRPPTPEEESAAPGQAGAGTAEHYEEMAQLGAEVEGEGQIP
jgi:hypothetical protein